MGALETRGDRGWKRRSSGRQHSAEGRTAFRAGDYATAKERFEAALVICRQARGETHPRRGPEPLQSRSRVQRARRLNRGTELSHAGLGNLPASSWENASRRSRQPHQSSISASCRRNWATTLPHATITCRPWAISRQALGETHPDVATSVSNLSAGDRRNAKIREQHWGCR